LPLEPHKLRALTTSGASNALQNQRYWQTSQVWSLTNHSCIDGRTLAGWK